MVNSILSVCESFDVEAEGRAHGLDIVTVYFFEDGSFSCIVESTGNDKQRWKRRGDEE